MRRGPTVCGVPGCPEFRPCPNTHPNGDPHERKPWSGGDQEQRARRKAETSSPEWRKLRAQVLRLWPICYLCGMNPSEEVDHIIPDTEGGTDDLGNLAGACGPCHRKKSAQEGQRARQRVGGDA